MIQKKFQTILVNISQQLEKSTQTKYQVPKENIDSYLSKINSNNKTIFMEPTTQWEILKIINSLPSKKSSGYDGISNVVLKEITPTIINPLTIIFNMSLTQASFPDCMKLAEIIALYKSRTGNFVLTTDQSHCSSHL